MKFHSLSSKKWVTSLVLVAGFSSVVQAVPAQAVFGWSGKEKRTKQYREDLVERKNEVENKDRALRKAESSLAKAKARHAVLSRELKALGPQDASCTKVDPNDAAAAASEKDVVTLACYGGTASATNAQSFDAVWRSKFPDLNVPMKANANGISADCVAMIKRCSAAYQGEVSAELDKVAAEVEELPGKVESAERDLQAAKEERREFQEFGCPDCEHNSGVYDPYKNMWKTAAVEGAFGLGSSLVTGGMMYGLGTQAINAYSNNYSNYMGNCIQLGSAFCGAPYAMGMGGMGGMGMGYGGLGYGGGFGMMPGMGMGYGGYGMPGMGLGFGMPGLGLNVGLGGFGGMPGLGLSAGLGFGMPGLGMGGMPGLGLGAGLGFGMPGMGMGYGGMPGLGMGGMPGLGLGAGLGFGMPGMGMGYGGMPGLGMGGMPGLGLGAGLGFGMPGMGMGYGGMPGMGMGYGGMPGMGMGYGGMPGMGMGYGGMPGMGMGYGGMPGMGMGYGGMPGMGMGYGGYGSLGGLNQMHTTEQMQNLGLAQSNTNPLGIYGVGGMGMGYGGYGMGMGTGGFGSYMPIY